MELKFFNVDHIRKVEYSNNLNFSSISMLNLGGLHWQQPDIRRHRCGSIILVKAPIRFEPYTYAAVFLYTLFWVPLSQITFAKR